MQGFETVDTTRKVGLGLGIGVFFLPIFFVWFLLRNGHSTLSRIFGFGWFGLVVLSVLTPAQRPSSNASNLASTAPTASNATVNTSRPSDQPVPPQSKWQYSENRDEMRNAFTRSARLISENELDFSFPYGAGNSVELVLQNRPQDGISVYIEVESGQFLCHSFQNSVVSVKFDDGPVQRFRCSDTSDGSTNIAFLTPTQRFISRLRSAQRVVIEAEFYREGTRQIVFEPKGLNWN